MFEILMAKYKIVSDGVPVVRAVQIAFAAQLIKDATQGLNAEQLAETLGWVSEHVAFGAPEVVSAHS